MQSFVLFVFNSRVNSWQVNYCVWFSEAVDRTRKINVFQKILILYDVTD